LIGCSKSSNIDAENSVNSASTIDLTDTGIPNPAIRDLINQLKNEDARFNEHQPGNINSEINKKCHKLLYLIISNYHSIGLPANSIVSQDSNMYLIMSESLITGDTSCRIVEYGLKKPNMGASTKVYIQSYDKNIVNVTEALEAVTNPLNIPKIVIAQIYEFNGNHYAVVGEEKQGDQIKSLHLKVYKCSNNNWELVLDSDTRSSSSLELKGGNLENSTFNYEKFDTGILFFSKNRLGNILGQMYLDFTQDKPIIRTEYFERDSSFPENEENSNVGYLVIGLCSHDSQEVKTESDLRNKNGFQTNMINSSDWSNLAPGWYALIYGKYNNVEDAKNAATEIKSTGIDVYVKYSGTHK
jgi:hypothetical protein